MSKKGLGRGLGALIPEMDMAERERESITELEIKLIAPNPNQPRKAFDQERLAELADSIREHGVVQPIVVRAKGDRYEIVAGERRWRASQLAGLKKIPALVRDFTEAEVMEIALIENLQRADLNPLEEAEAFRVLLEEFQLTQDELARRLGKSRPQITNTLRLLQLDASAREEVRAGRLSMGHAKVLLGVENRAEQARLARAVAETGMSVRELEAAVKKAEVSGKDSKETRGGQETLSPDLLEVEHRLRELFGTPVKLVAGDHKGRIEITYFGEEGLGRILDVLGLSDQPHPTPPKGPFRV